MTSPVRARAVAELDALTEQLPERADQLARRLARVAAVWSDPGFLLNGRRWIDGTPNCPRCLTKACPGCEPVRQDPTVVVVNGGVCELAGPDAEPLCVWCREPAGTCNLTAGTRRCERINEFYADQLAVAAAPRIPAPFRAGGC